MSGKASDYYDSDEDLLAALDAAQDNAKSPMAMGFVGDMISKHERWGYDMFMTPKQYGFLDSLATGENNG